MEKEHQITLSKMLGLGDFDFEREKPASWAEIYEAIGKLKERANQPPVEKYIPCSHPMPLTYTTNHPFPVCMRCGGEVRGAHVC